jgi:uncharacterized protein (DUF2164 family)
VEIKLDPGRRRRAVANIQKLFSTEFDETLSDFRAEAVVDQLLNTLGPDIYNQAVQDVRAHLQGKLDDLDGEVFADPS